MPANFGASLSATLTLDLAKHIVNQKAARFDRKKLEDHYETALIDLISQKRAGKVIRPEERPKGENGVDLMEAFGKPPQRTGGVAIGWAR